MGLMSRLQNFLPEMRAANAALIERIREEGSSAVNIEVVADDAEYIKMVRVSTNIGGHSTSS